MTQYNTYDLYEGHKTTTIRSRPAGNRQRPGAAGTYIYILDVNVIICNM